MDMKNRFSAEFTTVFDNFSNCDELSQSFDVFCRTLIHEIKNPLSLLKGNLEIIALHEPKVKDLKRWQNVNNNIEQITNILNDFSNISKMFNIKMEYINIVPIILETYDSFQIIANDKNIDFTIDLEISNPFYIMGDPHKLKQAFINLVKNAFEACTYNDKISIKCSLNDSFVNIIINDTGCGMNEQVIDSILCPFVTFKENGTGLGLTLVNHIIKEHKGHLLISSTVKQGSSFTVRLPF